LDRRLLTPVEVAERLGVCRDTVYRLCDRGGLPHVRVGNAIRTLPRSSRGSVPENVDPTVDGPEMALGTAPPQAPEAAPEGETPPEEPSAE
jgi:excisionase family DNA binding protein